jgi:diguanylate cyclase (GGDEF)-like protein
LVSRSGEEHDLTAVPTSWAAQQLTEFLAAVSVADDEAAAIREAVERATEAFEAEVGVVLGPDGVVAATGFGINEVPLAAIDRVRQGETERLEVPGIGECQALSTPIGDTRLSAMVLARHDELVFSSEERNLARGMARMLALTVRLQRLIAAERGLRELSERQGAENARLVESLAERQRLLERLSKIQRSIVSRRDLDEVFAAIVAGAQELLGDETVGLRLIDPDDPGMLNLVASAGVPDAIVDEMRRSPIGLGAGGRAAAEGRLIVIEDYAGDSQNLPAFAADGIRSALGAPVREQGEVVGSLVVATHRPGRTYSRAEREMLVAFAEHASLALNDAKTVEDAIHQAFHDSLTGLPNRQLLVNRLGHALARASRSGTKAAVLFVDLDTFKNVNDSLGHAAGDELLKEAANRLMTCVRAADTAARFGGDEFVVLLEDVDLALVTRVASRILETMGEPFEIRNREVFIGASIGIAIGGDEADDLLRDADLALYRAKSKGKGQKQVYEPEMHVEMIERLELEESLAKALRAAELILHYQPIIELRTQRMAGVEALVRWQHPTRGLLLPGEFIPVAEDSRLMLPLGRWVLGHACAQAAAWRRRHPTARELTLSVNFSSAQFSDAGLVEGVRKALIDSGLPPEMLVLELTETAFFRDSDAVAERMVELKRLGVRLAVDDFGTGNASLRHLARFPVDILKVDRSFVERIGVDRRQTAIAGSMIALGDSLEMSVVAEGIETPDQLAKLVALGCELGQGFYLAKPMDSVDLEAMLERPASGALTVGAGTPDALLSPR